MRQSKLESRMAAHPPINGWQFDCRVRVVAGLSESYYRNANTNWTARELHRGPHNQFMGLLIRDTTGKHVRVVSSVKELP